MAGLWSIVIPEDSINYIPNPSFEKDSTNWSSTGSGLSTTRTKDWQKRDLFSLELDHSVGGVGGIRYSMPAHDLADFSTGDYLTLSLDLRVVLHEFRITLTANYTAGGSVSSTEDYDTAQDGYARVVHTIGPLSGAINALYVDIESVTGSPATAYVDGIQLEAKAYATTYFDGSSGNGHKWLGLIYASKSIRDGLISSGGRDVDLHDLGYYVEEYTQVGMPRIRLLFDKQPLIPGDLLRDYTVDTRSMSLLTTNTPDTLSELHDLRRELINILKPDSGNLYRPLILRYHGANRVLETNVIYDSGLEFVPLDGFSEKTAIRLIGTDPFWYEDGNKAVDIDTVQTFTTHGGLLRKYNGIWAAIGSGISGGSVSVWAESPDNSILLGGSFTSVDGVANTSQLASFDPETTTWSSIGVVNGSDVLAIEFDSLGNIYVGGSFVDIDSVANTSYLAKYDKATSTWVSITPSGSPDSTIRDILYLPTGELVVTGNFTAINGVAANRIAIYDGSTWAALGTGLNNVGRTLAYGGDGYIYVGGDFTTADGVTVNRIAYWDETTFVALGSGVDAAIYSIVFDPTGVLYLGGDFTTVDGETIYGVAKWNGIQFSALGGGLIRTPLTPPNIAQLFYGSDGNLLATGTFNKTADDSLEFSSGIALWNGFTWSHFDLAVTSVGHALYQDMDNGYYVAGSPALASEITSVDNTATATTYPKLYIERSGGTEAIIKWLKNISTDSVIWLDHDLLDGEMIELDFVPLERSVTSSKFGLIWKSILQASDVEQFRLLPGNNNIAMLVDESGSPTISATLWYRLKYWSLDGA